MARRDVLICLVLLLATLGVYSRVAHYDFVNYDDPDYTTGNVHVRAGLTPASIGWAFTSRDAANWIPLTWLSHMLDRELFGFDAGRHHLTNLALHLLSTLLLYGLFKRMTGGRPASAFVAFVFALHPLHIESVAWIAERKDVLSALFWFLTIWAYLSYVKQPTVWRYAVMAAAFCCALMSKSMAVTLPFALLLLDVWPLRRFPARTGKGVRSPALTGGAGGGAGGASNVQSPTLTGGAGRPGGVGLVVEKLPLIGLAIAASIVTLVVQRGGGAVVDNLPLGLRVENAVNSYAVYLVKFFWPSNLAVFYPFAAIPVWQAALAALALAAITAFVLVRRTTRPYLAVGWFWYLGTLAPVIGVIQAGLQARADRYTYIPAIGIAIMLAWSVLEIGAKRRWLRPPLALLGILVCAGWATVTWSDLKYWRNSNALFTRALEVTRDNYVAYSNLGEALRQAGENDEAIPDFERALRIMPHYPEAESGLGSALTSLGRLDQAKAHLAESVRLEPQSAAAHINLGAVFSKQDLAREAADQYRIALQLDPESAEAHCGLGVALAEQDRWQEALPQLFESVRINPDYADGRYNLGRVLALTGRTDEAMSQFKETIILQPSNAEAHYNLGTALAERGRMQQASDEFRAAVDIKPDYVNARFNYASALASMEHYDEAIPQFQAILRLKPDFQPARASLALCLQLRKHPGGNAKPAPVANPEGPPESKPGNLSDTQVKSPSADQSNTSTNSQTHRAKRKRTKKT